MKTTTQKRIKDITEQIYRIANFAPEDRDLALLTAIDEAGLHETEVAIRALLAEQDRETRHACAEAVLNLAQEPGEKIDVCKAHAACINVQTI